MKNNYFKYGLYILGTILSLWIVYILYKMFKRGKLAGEAVAAAVTNVATDSKLSNLYGLTTSEVSKARDLAHVVSLELETNNSGEQSWLDRQVHIAQSSKVVQILSQATSENMLKAVAVIYKGEFTAGNSLYRDLTAKSYAPFYWNNSDIFKIPFITKISNI